MIKEQKYYGIHACWTIWEKRPEDIVRVYIEQSNVKAFSPLLKWCAQNKKAYHIIPTAELDKVTDSVHHEGVCILAKEVTVLSEQEMRRILAAEKRAVCLLYLDGVENPHNLGSILRTAAHFGIPYILGEKLPPLSASACRIAKGGAEMVRLVALKKPIQTLEWLKQRGFSFFGTSSHGGTSLYQTRFPPKTILAMGAESEGVSKALMKLASQSIKISGTGIVDSLNVAVATALCIGEYCRQHGNR